VTATISDTDYQGLASGTFTINAATQAIIIPIDVTLHTIDRKKWGACGYDSFGRARGECKNQIPNLQARVYDMKNTAFRTAWGSNPDDRWYDDIYESTAQAGFVASCTTDAWGEALCYEPYVSDYLVIVKYVGPANIKYPSSKTLSLYAGKKVSARSFQSTPTNTGFQGPLKNVRPAGALWARDVDIHLRFHLLKTINRHDDIRNDRDGRCDYGDGGRSVYQGSYFEIIYPSYTVWEEGVTDYLYPFILTGDTDWTVDICGAVPQGYQIVGVYDTDGNLIASTECIQAGVAGETKVVAFEVLDLQSPPPSLSADVKIKHKGKTEKARFETRGHRKGKDKKKK
jgi:hypothetical protein